MPSNRTGAAPHRVLLAFDKFKGSLSARRASRAARETLQRARPAWLLEERPLTDGGDGFCELLTSYIDSSGHPIGNVEWFAVPGPRFEDVRAPIGFVDDSRLPPHALQVLAPHTHDVGRIAIVEMAAASGLHLLASKRRDPFLTSSLGTGELLRLAGNQCDLILLGIGGSATHDVGVGALEALGLSFLDAHGRGLSTVKPRDFPRIANVAGRWPAAFPELRIACDVDNPLLGPNGAATVYGPQKGLSPGDVESLDRETERIARLLLNHTGKDDRMLSMRGAGAAGGIGFGLSVCGDAELVSGFDLVEGWFEMDRAIEAADLVITGEGRFDASSLAGKAPGRIVRRSLDSGKQCLVVAGSVDRATRTQLEHDLGCDVIGITPPETPLADALVSAEENLRSALAAWIDAPPTRR